MKYKLYSVVFILIWIGQNSLALKAQSVKVVVATKKIKLDNQFEYKLMIQGEPTSYTTPDFKDFIIRSGPNQSTTMNWHNGIKTTSMSLYWTLEPKHTGKLRIGSSKIKFANKFCMSKVIRIKVAPAQKSITKLTPLVYPHTVTQTPFMLVA